MSKRTEAIERALRDAIYEATHLSPEEGDGSHWAKMSAAWLDSARAALAMPDRLRGLLGKDRRGREAMTPTTLPDLEELKSVLRSKLSNSYIAATSTPSLMSTFTPKVLDALISALEAERRKSAGLVVALEEAATALTAANIFLGFDTPLAVIEGHEKAIRRARAAIKEATESAGNPRPADRRAEINKHMGQVAALWRDLAEAIERGDHLSGDPK